MEKDYLQAKQKIISKTFDLLLTQKHTLVANLEELNNKLAQEQGKYAMIQEMLDRCEDENPHPPADPANTIEVKPLHEKEVKNAATK